jgi:hypothetical protein
MSEPLPVYAVEGSSALAPAGVEPLRPASPPPLRVLPRPEGGGADLPPPPAALLLRGLLEVLHGWRPAAQMAMRTSPEIAADLLSRPGRRSPSRPPQVERIRVLRVADGAAEVCAVLRRERRCGALAMRLEHGPRGWIVTRLQVG